uniref:Uncharacterized protein n=1 Tax=Cacopsylla melanoneura TaxID=428564 RepID=A0A8D8WZ35_9HEMI
MLMNHLVLFESHWKTSIPKLSPKKTFNCQNSIPSTRLLCENDRIIELLHTQLHHLVLTGHLILLYLVLTVDSECCIRCSSLKDIIIGKLALFFYSNYPVVPIFMFHFNHLQL